MPIVLSGLIDVNMQESRMGELMKKIESSISEGLPSQALYILVLACPVLTGIFLHATMPRLGWHEYQFVISAYGAVVAFSAIAAGLCNKDLMMSLTSSKTASGILLLLALMILAGALIPPGPDPHILSVHRTYYFSGLLGLLAAQQVLAVVEELRNHDKAMIAFFSKVAAHTGILFILVAAALGTAFSREGTYTLSNGGESRIFAVTHGPHRKLAGQTDLIRNCHVVKLRGAIQDPGHTEYYVNCSPGFSTAAFGMLLFLSGILVSFIMQAKIKKCGR